MPSGFPARLPPKVDRGFAKIVAYKRAVTGVLSIAGAGLLVAMGMSRNERPGTLLYFGAALFLFTGAWALRDGLRIFRALR